MTILRFPPLPRLNSIETLISGNISQQSSCPQQQEKRKKKRDELVERNIAGKSITLAFSHQDHFPPTKPPSQRKSISSIIGGIWCGGFLFPLNRPCAWAELLFEWFTTDTRMPRTKLTAFVGITRVGQKWGWTVYPEGVKWIHLPHRAGIDLSLQRMWIHLKHPEAFGLNLQMEEERKK